jgi:hypothetical protein
MVLALIVWSCDGTPGGEEEAQEGQLPTWQVGDQWVWSYVQDSMTSILSEEVIGEETVEGRVCYIVDMSFDPVMSWTQGDVECAVTSMKYWSDRDTGLNGVKHEMSTTCNGQVNTTTFIYSYDLWVSIFPLEVGKEIEAEKTATQYYDGEQMGDPVVGTETYEVVGQENVTVAAGTFSCWKIAYYDSVNDVAQTIWYSDEVKTAVKSIGEDGNTIMELQSYSVE